MHLHFTQSLEALQGAGLGYAAHGLHAAMLARGITSRFVTTSGDDRDRSLPGVTEYRRSGPEKCFYSREMVRVAAALVADVDVVHGHGFYVALNWLLGRQARMQGKPLVYHVHGFLDPWITARSRGKKRLAHLLFEDANFRHAGLWRAVSLKEEQQIRDYGIKAPVVVLPNGVDLPKERTLADLAEMDRLFPKIRPRRLVFLSRIHAKKGLDLLIKAWVNLPSELTATWEVALFGPDEGGYASDVQGWIDEAGLGDSVRLMGSVSGEAKEAAFRSADLFVLPSYSEGFPMAVLEAASFGVPVVLTDECNFPELALAGGGWECTPESESLARSLTEALSCDDTERRQRGSAGRRLVAEGYTWESVAVRLDEACREHL